MEQTQNTNAPQEPKKSFWAKLFGGGKPASSPASTPPVTPADPPASDSVAPESTTDTPTDNSLPPVAPAESTENLSPVEPSAEQPAWNNEAVPSPNETPVPPVPTWRDTPAGVTEPLAEVPVPPSDPMVTPVQQAEAENGPVVVPLDTVETPASTPEDSSTSNDSQAPSATSSQENQGSDNRPSLTPPPAR